jgi:formate hydrogenlyase transcriptional activator
MFHATARVVSGHRDTTISTGRRIVLAQKQSYSNRFQGLRYDALRRVSRTIAAHRDPQELFDILADELHPIVSFNLLRVFLYEESRHVLRAFVREPIALAVPPEFPPDEYPAWWVYTHQEPLVLSAESIEARFPRMMRLVKEFKIQSHCTLPLTTANRQLGVLAIGSEQPDTYSHEAVRFLSLVADQIALAIDNALAYTQIAELKEKLTEEKLYLEEGRRADPAPCTATSRNRGIDGLHGSAAR